MDINKVIEPPSKPKAKETADLMTVWGENIDPEHVRDEHPRPQFAREGITMLNGWWDLRILRSKRNLSKSWKNAPAPEKFDRKILVPFSPEAKLSGVGKQIHPDELLWYKKVIDAPEIPEGGRCILHFEAVDYACACYVNGVCVGTHTGGYIPFSFDITDAVAQTFVRKDKSVVYEKPREVYSSFTEILLCVWDPSETGTQLRGKQRIEHGGIWYTAQSGIWGPVWLECVPYDRIDSIVLTPSIEDEEIHISVKLHGEDGHLHIDVTDSNEDQVANESCMVDSTLEEVKVSIPVEGMHLWTTDDPFLYYLELRFGDDVVHTYCAFRSVSIERDDDEILRFCLNGEPVLMRGVLDQGYWPDGLMTAPSDEAFVYDIKAMKAAGFNMLRKHVKVECDRYYYHCDRLGMLVMQDMVCGGSNYEMWEVSQKPLIMKSSWGNYRDDVMRHQKRLGAGENSYRSEWVGECIETVRHLSTHPCIVGWVLFNEGWGQFDAEAVSEMVHDMDPTRTIDAVSGWYDQHCADYLSVHNYFRKLEVYPDKPKMLTGYVEDRAGRAFLLSEFGGIICQVAGHSMHAGSYGYKTYETLSEWADKVDELVRQADSLYPDGLAGFVYTQLSDVEEEVNGLLTYDRRVNKLELARLETSSEGNGYWVDDPEEDGYVQVPDKRYID
ncbi:MAG: glycoside hydrolase family 2 [Eggerthellaceae bacterium]|nr:glycoside hydrolase family 2 [Eggerthellaceae bacterium]